MHHPAGVRVGHAVANLLEDVHQQTERIADEAVGTTLGRYKLLECVGEGGCGVVYVAEQTEPVRRRVALKVIDAAEMTRDSFLVAGLASGGPPRSGASMVMESATSVPPNKPVHRASFGGLVT